MMVEKDQLTNGPTDGQADVASYTVACTRLWIHERGWESSKTGGGTINRRKEEAAEMENESIQENDWAQTLKNYGTMEGE